MVPPSGQKTKEANFKMGMFSKDKEQERYYLLPGMGGRASQRKQRIALIWALLVGLVVSVAFAAAVYWLSTQKTG